MPINWDRILGAITTVASILGLVILVLGAISVAAIVSGLDTPTKSRILFGLAILACPTLVAIPLLAFYRPQNLVYSVWRHIQELEAPYGERGKRVLKNGERRKRVLKKKSISRTKLQKWGDKQT